MAAERDAVLAGGPGPCPGLTAVAGGVGPAAGVRAALALAAAARAERPVGAVVCAGVAGGFSGRAPVGGLVVADAVVAADLGAQDADGSFLTLDDLGLAWPVEAGPDPELTAALATALGPATVRGTVLSVATVTGTDARAAELAARWSPAAEAMEGYPVALAAAAVGVPFAEVRAVSNLVGRRDRASWDLPGALAALGRLGAALVGW